MTIRKKMILIVDDERIITKTLQRLFKRELKYEPYEIVTNNDPLQALNFLSTQKENGIELAVVISDILMPEMNGLDFLAEVTELYPQAASIVLTGFADVSSTIKALNELDLFHFIEKPWENEHITQLLINAISKNRQDKTENLFRRYVPHEIIEEYDECGNDAILDGKLIDATVLFLKIVDCTERTAKSSPEDIVQRLNNYFTAFARSIHDRNGFLDKYTGNGLMALFGVHPSTGKSSDNVRNAVLAALDIAESISDLNSEYDKPQTESIHVSIGLDTGKVIVGNIGSVDRVNFTAIGDVVDTASRIENIAREFIDDDLTCILISNEIYEIVKDIQNYQCDFKVLHPVKLKANDKAVKLHRVSVQVEV